MVCLLCGLWAGNLYGFEKNVVPNGTIGCRRCAHSLRPIAPVRLAGGALVRAAYAHEGAIRTAIHALKYRGVDAIAAVLAPVVAVGLHPNASALVPVPRSPSRKARYGIDQARALAKQVSRHTGVPVLPGLRAPLFRRSQIQQRSSAGPRFQAIAEFPAGAVLVDDVITTGATLNAAAMACGPMVTYTISRAPLS